MRGCATGPWRSWSIWRAATVCRCDRAIAGWPQLDARFADLLALAMRVRFQDHRQRDPKVYALHAPEVECIGKGRAKASYEFNPPPAGSFLGGFRTPAAAPDGSVTTGRHPKPYTDPAVRTGRP